MTEEQKRRYSVVRVRYNGAEYNGYVRGYKLQFAQVWIADLDLDFQFAWPTVARAVDEKRTLCA